MREGGWAPAAVFCYGMLVAGALGLYERYPWIDNAMHFAGGAALAYFFGLFVRRDWLQIALVLAVALLWEAGEATLDALQATQTWKGPTDTAWDLFFGLGGAVAFLAGTGLARELVHGRGTGGTPGAGGGKVGSTPGGTPGR